MFKTLLAKVQSGPVLQVYYKLKTVFVANWSSNTTKMKSVHEYQSGGE